MHMNRLGTWLALALVGAALASAGCESKEAKELRQMTQQYNDLSLQYKDAQKNLADCQTRNADLSIQLESKEAEVATLKRDLTKAGTRPPGPPQPPQPPERPLPPGWERTPYGDRKTLASDILFAPGQATLSRQGQAELKKVAAEIKSHYAAALVRVYGYTDSDPIVKSAKLWQDNLDLSANRAMAVTRFLEGQGMSAEKVETVAMGQTHPLAPNRTAADKAKNRRVEIMVVLPR
jgi:flagellar motor protein MotB